MGDTPLLARRHRQQNGAQVTVVVFGPRVTDGPEAGQATVETGEQREGTFDVPPVEVMSETVGDPLHLVPTVQGRITRCRDVGVLVGVEEERTCVPETAQRLLNVVVDR